MIDLSDGLASDLRHICRASGVGATVHLERLPLADDTRKLASLLRREPEQLAATGGEDFELLVTGSEAALKRIERASGIPVTPIGEVTVGDDVAFLLNGERIEGLSGWDHFET